LKNLGKSDLPFVGLGDYMYSCHPGDNVAGKRLGDLYADISNKIGAEGNHEAVRGQEEQWAEDTFKYPNDFAAWKLKDLGIIVMNPYVAFKKGSDQYNFIVNKSKTLDANPFIKTLVYVVHEPLYTPAVTGGHGANVQLKELFAPVIKEHKGFLLEAHNHITAFGKVDGINQAICGGGGSGGDTLGKLNGFTWGTSKDFGYCEFTFNQNNITAKLVGNNQVNVKEYTFTR
jgi:hypothetical protein